MALCSRHAIFYTAALSQIYNKIDANIIYNVQITDNKSVGVIGKKPGADKYVEAKMTV